MDVRQINADGGKLPGSRILTASRALVHRNLAATNAIARLRRLQAAALRRVHAVAEQAASLVTGHDATTGKRELSDLTIAGHNIAAGVHFVSTPWAVLRWVHACLPPDAQKQGWTFLDLGAGKGRAVLSAAAKPYKQVVGVEFAAELAAIARANVRDSGHAPPRVSIIEGDATCTSLPDGALIVFLFNPFGPPAIDQVLERLVEHHRRTHAPVRIAYLNPEHEPLLLRHPGFKRRPLPRHMATLFAVASPYRLALFDAVSAICGSIRIRQRWCVDRSAIVCERQRHTGSFRKIVA